MWRKNENRQASIQMRKVECVPDMIPGKRK